MPALVVSFAQMPADARGALTDDAVLGGRLRLMQPRTGHRVGHDAILLAAAVGANPGEHAVDLGAGVGAAGLSVAVRVPRLRVTLVERDGELAVIAAENAARNGLADRVRCVALDIGATAGELAAAGLGPESADHVLMNPPFRDPARHNVSPDPRRRRAHVAGSPLDLWVGCAARLLRPRGTLTLIWPADGLAEVVRVLPDRFGALAIMPVHARPGAAAIRILVRARKGSAAPLEIVPALLLNDEGGTPSEAAEAVLRQGASLPLLPPL
jgi:tRNA1(Val) A37 N6-methylase TrmN6